MLLFFQQKAAHSTKFGEKILFHTVSFTQMSLNQESQRDVVYLG
jgi:hypothetical protein